MAKTFGQTVPLEKPQAPGATPPAPAPAPIPRLRPSRFGRVALTGGALLSLFWIGVACAFIWGLLGPQGVDHLTLAAKAAFAAGILLPPFLFLSVAAALARSAAMTDATRALLVASERLFAADETAANNAARLARAVRRELDGLNTGLDVAFQVEVDLLQLVGKLEDLRDRYGLADQGRFKLVALGGELLELAFDVEAEQLESELLRFWWNLRAGRDLRNRDAAGRGWRRDHGWCDLARCRHALRESGEWQRYDQESCS